MRPRTKIVATLGPATDRPGELERLVEAGTDVVRLNLSHGDTDGHLRRLAGVREIERQLDRFIGVLVDLPGPKIRAADFGDQPIVFAAGDRVSIRHGASSSDHEVIGVGLMVARDAVAVDDRIVIGDGAISLRVRGLRDHEILTEVESPGSTQGRPGVHFATATRGLGAPTSGDLELARRFVAEDIDFMAISYVRAAQDVLAVRAVTGDDCALVAKIESGAAVTALADLITVSDAIMVARGDLGIDVALEDVPHLQKEIIGQCVAHGRPVITATQMLESMIAAPTPTRAEVSDVANAVLDGTDAVMLSGETALGVDPSAVVRTMVRILIRAERRDTTRSPRASKSSGRGPSLGGGPLDADEITRALAHAGAQAASDLEVAGIVCCTRTGRTVRALAGFRPATGLFALSPSVATLRRCVLSHGVVPLLVSDSSTTDDMIALAVERCIASGSVLPGDVVVVIAGAPERPSGAAADTVRIVRIP